MTDTLSDSQIDALFAAHRDGSLPAAEERRVPAARVSTVDFSRPSKFTKDQERQLRRAHETFCRTASTGLSADIRTAIDLEVIGIAQLNWSNAVLEAGKDAVWSVIELSPLGTHLVMTLERSFILTLIDRLCGGSSGTVAEDRKLTDIDLAMSRRVFRLFVDQLSLVWHELAGVSLGFKELELEPQSAQIAPFSEPTLVLTMEVRLHKHSFALGVMLPYTSIEQASGRFSASHSDDPAKNPRATADLRRALRGVAIELRAEIASVEIKADELLALREGDVVRLGSSVGGITVLADDTPIHRAKPGRVGAQRAVQIAGDGR